MQIGLVSPAMSGHLNPSLALGRELVRQGHRVSVITTPQGRAEVERAGFEMLPIGVPEENTGRIEAALSRLARLQGTPALIFTGYLLARASGIIFRDLPDVLRRADFDGLVVDQACPAAAVVAERAALPYVVICNALAIHYDPVCPPPPTLWRYRTDWLGRTRNRIALRTLPPIFDRITGVKRAGTSPLMLSFAEPLRGLAHISQQPAFFDFPRIGLPAHFHYTGPWHERIRDDDVPFPWERLDGRPLIYASLGTIQNGRKRVYAAMIAAAQGFDAQLVISLGRADASLDITPPDNVILVPFAPQIRLLEKATVAITHAGHNTALECLAHGVPMVCLPVTNDQPGVARRVEWIGAGEVLPIRRVTATRLRELLARVLDDPSYRRSAQRFRDQIAAVNGPELAAKIIERAFLQNEPVMREDKPARGESSFSAAAG